MSGQTHNQLRIVLLALLPKDGGPMTVASLAKVAGVSSPAVTNALFDDWFAKRIDFDVRSDAYSAKKQGDQL
jgi:hypothetical protein